MLMSIVTDETNYELQSSVRILLFKKVSTNDLLKKRTSMSSQVDLNAYSYSQVKQYELFAIYSFNKVDTTITF